MGKLFCLNKKNGFTLIELVAVFAIIAILFTVGMISAITYSNSQKKEVLKTTCRRIVTSASSFGYKKVANNYEYAGDTYYKTNDDDKSALSPYIGNPLGVWIITIDSSGTVTSVDYTDENGKRCVYTGSTGVYSFP